MNTLTQILKALSDPNRLRILKMLEVKPLCVCEITSILGLATSTTSKHLSILKNVNLIFEQKEGRWVNYYLNAATQSKYNRELSALLKSWLDNDPIIRDDRIRMNRADRNKLNSR